MRILENLRQSPGLSANIYMLLFLTQPVVDNVPSEETLFITPFKGTSLLGLAILVILICFVVLTVDQGGGWRQESCFSV